MTHPILDSPAAAAGKGPVRGRGRGGRGLGRVLSKALPRAIMVLVILLALAGLARLLLPGEAKAHSCARTWTVKGEASRVISSVNGRLARMEATIAEALRRQTGQQSGYTAKSARAIAGAIDTQTRLHAQTAREAAEVRAIQARRPSRAACRTVTGLKGLAPARATEEAHAARAASAERRRHPTPGDGSARDPDSERFRHLAARHDRGADLAPAGLFDAATLATPEQRDAARELARNLAAPLVHAAAPLAAADTAAERRRALQARATGARDALAIDYFTAAQARRVPVPGAAGEALARWAGAIAPGSARQAGESPSRHELLQLLAARRFEDPAWFVGLQAMSEANLLRELVVLQAISSMLDWERYRLDERRGALEAARLAGDLDRHRRDPRLAATPTPPE